jgi:hypothetical protein
MANDRSGLQPSGCSALRASIPNASALNVAAGLFMDEGGVVYPVTNWLDEDGDECPRDAAVVAVAGDGGCWFSLILAEFVKDHSCN